jgi:adenylosuccinate synthase
MKRAVITVGLGFGDEGKGGTVDALCRRLGADLVVRYCGGSQAGHNVELPDGRRHTFAQFGAGTLAGVPSHLGRHVILSPPALCREADHLRELGVADPFALLTVHRRALVATAFHQAMNRLRELARGAARHGSCGHGIGEARAYWLRHGEAAIFAADLHDPAVLRDKLELLRQRLWLDAQEFIDRVPAGELAEMDVLGLSADAVAVNLHTAAGPLRLVDRTPPCDTAVFEGAQGVLLDEWYGFHPHTTWSTVTQRHALEMAAEAGAAEVCSLGLVRAYLTRHGAGPLPTFDADLTAALPDEGNPPNPWQGGLRLGWLDLVLVRYAARVGGPLDGLVVNCLDQLEGREAKLGVAYESGSRLPLPVGPSLAGQERLTRLLEQARPIYRPAGGDAIIGALGEIAPVVLCGRGPTHRDKGGVALPFRRGIRGG